MSAGKLLYNLFYKPTQKARYHLDHFGLRNWIKKYQGELQMKKCAAKASPIHLSTDPNCINLSFLSGEKYWHQTIFAIKSLHNQIGDSFSASVYSDGTLKKHHIAIIKKFAPAIQIKDPRELTKYLDKVLPEKEFPVLRSLRKWHPFFLRMLDIHCAPGWSVHLDSDMLFFNNPGLLLDAFKERTALYMLDTTEESHFVDKESVLKEKYNIDCLRFVNGGIIAYNNDFVDFKDLEQKARLLKIAYPDASPARMEQTLMSYLLYLQDAKPLDKNTYTIHYDSEIYVSHMDVVRHYIFKAKLPYFQQEWKSISL